jgi:hypothetical protein
MRDPVVRHKCSNSTLRKCGIRHTVLTSITSVGRVARARMAGAGTMRWTRALANTRCYYHQIIIISSSSSSKRNDRDGMMEEQVLCTCLRNSGSDDEMVTTVAVDTNGPDTSSWGIQMKGRKRIDGAIQVVKIEEAGIAVVLDILVDRDTHNERSGSGSGVSKNHNNPNNNNPNNKFQDIQYQHRHHHLPRHGCPNQCQEPPRYGNTSIHQKQHSQQRPRPS